MVHYWKKGKDINWPKWRDDIMKRFLFWLYLLIKRQVKNPMVLTTLILLPLITAIVSNIPQLNKSDKPKVGIVLADNDSLAKNTAEALVNGVLYGRQHRSSDIRYL